MKVGLTQLCVGDDPNVNVGVTAKAVTDLYDAGADLVCTPEVTGFVTTDPVHQQAIIQTEADDPTLAGLSRIAHQKRKWLSIGSLAVAGAGRFSNRSFLIDPSGSVVARYDKIHMFDVAVSDTEKYRESARYRPGSEAVLADTALGKIGLTICYDLRFPHLYRALAQAGAEVILVPSAFAVVTGAAHWETLLRARAIETGCFIVAAAQSGVHVTAPKRRETYGHSLVVNPWGEVILNMGQACGTATVDLDLKEVAQARQRIPSLSHDRPFTGP